MFSGLRISDLLRLRVRDLRGVKSITVTEKKTGKVKTVVFDLEMTEALDWFFRYEHLREGDYVFYQRPSRRNIPVSRQWVNHIIALTARYLGLESIGAHSMRKIYACNIYRATGSLVTVQRALNHGKPEVTLHYLRDVLN